MTSKLFRLLATVTLLSMLITPVSAQTNLATTHADRGPVNQLTDVTTGKPGELNSGNKVVINEVKAATGPARYIVVLSEPAVASYLGGVEGLEATSPAVTGAHKLDAKNAASLAYASYLRAQQDKFVANLADSVGHNLDVTFRYQYALNGLTLVLSQGEARRVAQMDGVRFIERETVYNVDTDAGPKWIGAGSIWDGTAAGGVGNFGAGVVVGIIDTGINHDHPSFAISGTDGYTATLPAGMSYVGVCDPANTDIYIADFCTPKLIGAWDFVYDLTDPATQTDYPSPEDENGHGSHTASTVAGNFANAGGVTVSGVAPHASIIAYDVCYTNNDDGTGSCPSISSAAAAEQAVVDGVDVINFSIGGGNTPYTDAVEWAFLGATEAGIFVSASAGNSGPDASTNGHNGPWVSTTAAATHNRAGFSRSLNTLTGGDTTPPADLTGQGFGIGVGPAPIVYAGNYGDPLCPLDAFAPGTLTGKIVVCDRGTHVFVDKIHAVAVGGAIAVVVVNVPTGGTNLNTFNGEIPTLTLNATDGTTLKTWLATGTGHQAKMSDTLGPIISADAADVLANFSSRGPATTVSVLKPNTTAPGVAILAAVQTPDPANPGAAEWDFYQGTSMSSPHNAGAGALLKAVHPDWTPLEIQSALMMTSNKEVFDLATMNLADYFAMGAGRVQVDQAAQAGFVLDETGTNFELADPYYAGDVRSLNLASITDNACVRTCTWQRTIQSTLDVTATWDVSTTTASTITLAVTPSSFTLAPGATQVITVDVDMAGMPLGEWGFGELVFDTDTAGVPDARIPVSGMAVRIAAPSSVYVYTRRNAGAEVITGFKTYNAPTLNVTPVGLVKGSPTIDEISQDPTLDDPIDDLSQVFVYSTTVPSGAARFVAEIVASESPDLDLFVFRDADEDGVPTWNDPFAYSATGTALEYVSWNFPPAGTWFVVIQNYQGTASQPDLFRLSTAVVPYADAGGLTFDAPASITDPTTFDITMFWEEPTLLAMDRAYGGFSLGSTSETPMDLARIIPVDIARYNTDVYMTVDPTSAMPGDVVTYTINLRPTLIGVDPTYWMTSTLSTDLTLVPGSAAAATGTVTEGDGVIYWTGQSSDTMTTIQYAAVISDTAAKTVLVNMVDHITDQLGAQVATARVALNVGPFDVTFQYHDLEGAVPADKDLYVAGEFNGWNTTANKLTPNADRSVFTATFEMPLQTTLYKYVIGGTWDNGGGDMLNTDNRSLDATSNMTVDDYRAVLAGYTKLLGPTEQTVVIGDPTAIISGEAWINNVTSVVGVGVGVIAEVGYGTQSDYSDFTWFPAAFLKDSGNNDVFGGVITPTLGGVFTYTMRFNGNTGEGNPNFASGWAYTPETGTLTVTNDAPVLAPIGDLEGIVGDTLVFTATATDAEGGPLTFSLGAGAPTGATIDPVTGFFSWAPTETGVFTVTVIVTDPGLLTDTEDVVITVEHALFMPLIYFGFDLNVP